MDENTKKKDIIGSVSSISQIDQFFSFTKKYAVFRHTMIIILYLFSSLMITLSVFFRFAVGAEIITLVCIIGTSILIGRMLLQKNASYRFIVYCTAIAGLVFMILAAHFIPSFLIILYSGYTIILMVNFLTIENTLYRGMSPALRMNKKANFEKFGYDKLDEM